MQCIGCQNILTSDYLKSSTLNKYWSKIIEEWNILDIAIKIRINFIEYVTKISDYKDITKKVDKWLNTDNVEEFTDEALRVKRS